MLKYKIPQIVTLTLKKYWGNKKEKQFCFSLIEVAEA